MQDNLRQPLKRRNLGDRLRKLKPSGLQSVSALVVAGMLTGGVWLYRHDVPLAGEPVVVMKISPLEKLTTARVPKKSQAKTETEKSPDEIVAEKEILAEPEPDPEDLAADRAAAKQKVAIIQRAGRILARPLRAAPIKSVSERGPYGTLPRIARNGRKPSDVYASRLSDKFLHSGKPKIALVISGMGINVGLTNQAIKELPGHVTFAFAPYGRGLQRLINKARRSGHEIVLHLPMEPYGYPGINPGPKTLLAGADPLENLKNLDWLMSRFAGYSGVTNYMGAKFTTDGGALLPVFSRLKSRGLVYFDDGSNRANITGSIAQAAQLPRRSADVVIKGDQTFTSIQQMLKNLEKVASKKGLAIGTGAGLAATIDAVDVWSRDLEDRGFLLVPLSLAYRRAKS